MTLFGLDGDEPDVFTNRDVLKDRFVPDEIMGRESEKSELNSALRPVLRGTGSPDNVFISGPPGTGKTALVKNATDQIRMNPDLDVDVVWLNCQSISGETTLMLEIANSFRETGNKVSTRGYGRNQARELMFSELDGADAKTVLIVLDELDTVEIEDQLLYHLPRAHEHGCDTEVGLISISNQPDFITDIPSDVRSTLTDVPIQFSEYHAGQIRDVLQQRAIIAFRDTEVGDRGDIESSVLENEALELAAAKGAKHAGDARMARDLLRIGGDMALDRGEVPVTEDHVREAVEQYHHRRMIKTVNGFGETAKLVLYSLITLTTDGRDSPRTSEINFRYQALVDGSIYDPVSKRQVEKHMGKFDRLGLTETDTHGGDGGRYTTHQLQYEPEYLMDSLSDVVEQVGIHSSVESIVDPTAGD